MNSIKSLLNTKREGEGLNLLTFFFLYIAQSVPMTFFSTALQVLMRQSHFSLSSIAMLQLIKLPWLLKFLWAPYVDRQCVDLRGFKRFIIRSELVYAILILGLTLLDLQSDFYLILALISLSLVASATQDIATDALAVLTFDRKNKSMVNSMQSMGSFAGTLIGSGFLLLMLHHYGWKPIIPCLSLFALVAVIPLWRNRNLRMVQQKEEKRIRLVDIFTFFIQKGIWKQIVFLIFYYAGLIGILSVLRPYLVDNGYNMKDIGWISGILGTSVAVAVSFISGPFVRKYGRRVSTLLFAVLTLITTLCFVLQTFFTLHIWGLCISISLLWASYGMSSVIVYTSAMDHVRKGLEGTDFTIQTVLTHLSGLLIAMFSGAFADRLGYRNLFVFEAAIALISLIYIRYIYNKKQL